MDIGCPGWRRSESRREQLDAHRNTHTYINNINLQNDISY